MFKNAIHDGWEHMCIHCLCSNNVSPPITGYSPLLTALLNTLLTNRPHITGYSALLIAQALPPSGRVISIERDLTWVLSAKRFMWQASQGDGQKAKLRIGDRVSEDGG